MAEERASKSKRIQDYLRSHPHARNRDVVTALSEHGVTSADVSNAKTQLKRKMQPPILTTPLVVPTGSDDGKEAGGSAIAVAEINATIEFVQRVGGVTRAQQLLALFHQIQCVGRE
jgi:hypothetical protein